MRETIVDRAYAKTLLPPRKEDGHKGDFGKLCRASHPRSAACRRTSPSQYLSTPVVRSAL